MSEKQAALSALNKSEFFQRSNLPTLQSYFRSFKNSYFSSMCLNIVLALRCDRRPGPDASLHRGPGLGQARLSPLQVHCRSSSSNTIKS